MKANAVAKGHKAPLSKRLKRDWHKNKWKYIMILPVLIYLFLFCYKPMYGLVIAFKDFEFLYRSVFWTITEKYIFNQWSYDFVRIPGTNYSGAYDQ